MRGYRPFGATFGFNPNEQREPIDYSTHEIGASLERLGQKWRVRAGNTGSIYHNHVTSLTWDNPFSATDADRNQSSGRIDLYPENTRHNGTLSGVFTLPWRGRLTANVSYGIMSQDDLFLPFTINTGVEEIPGLPANSADAEIKNLHVNSALTLKPTRDLSLGLRIGYFDRDNQTSILEFSDYVRTDERLSGTV